MIGGSPQQYIYRVVQASLPNLSLTAFSDLVTKLAQHNLNPHGSVVRTQRRLLQPMAGYVDDEQLEAITELLKHNDD